MVTQVSVVLVVTQETQVSLAIPEILEFQDIAETAVSLGILDLAA